MYENILFEKKDGVAYLTLNRPDRLNALNSAVLKELDDALAAIDGDAEIRVLVVRGPERRLSPPERTSRRCSPWKRKPVWPSVPLGKRYSPR